MKYSLLAVVTPIALASAPAQAGEVFAGAYVHAVETPFTFATGEGGADLQLGYRLGGIEALKAVGKPAPYLIASLNTSGATSFAGAGLSWKLGNGPFYLRPGAGLVAHGFPTSRYGECKHGSRVISIHPCFSPLWCRRSLGHRMKSFTRMTIAFLRGPQLGRYLRKGGKEGAKLLS